ncbi:MAG: hypothetical protein R3B90_12750 [Planctomycetaceae bacterium]
MSSRPSHCSGFTFCLLDGLRGGAVQDGEIAWSDLFGYVLQPD